MIIGIGTDLVEVDRVVSACDNSRFLEKYFTSLEIELIKSDRKKSADNFAVKEAVSKMFGTGFRGFSLIDIEVLRDELGKPYVRLYQNALEISNNLGIKKIYVSISNTKTYAQAFVIGEGEI